MYALAIVAVTVVSLLMWLHARYRPNPFVQRWASHMMAFTAGYSLCYGVYGWSTGQWGVVLTATIVFVGSIASIPTARRFA
jgi:hypothetical protein